MTKSILFIALTFIITSTSISATVLKGLVTNSTNKKPIPFVSISIAENQQSIMTNEDGSFLIYIDNGTYSLKFSHIAYFTLDSQVVASNDTTFVDISLNPSLIELPAIKVYERNYDAAQQIIIEAIRNKDNILAKLNSYNFDAYTKLSIWNASNQDSLKPILITETELTSYWRYPSEYKEIITARKQSSNLNADDNLVSIGEVLNFNNNRIDIGDQSLVSPTAKDALEYYNYYLLDTLMYDSLPVYLLEIEPKSNTTPLFIGTIKINSQSYEVMGVELAINEGLDNPYLIELNFSQEYQLFDNSYWMPTVIQFNGLMEIPFPLIPTISFSYTAALQRYSFEKDYGDTIFNNYVLEVDKNADDFDSTQWLANRFIPLTITEEMAYDHIDSVKNNRPLYKKLLPIIPAALYAVSSMNDFFHFNRVEGPYLGGKVDFISPNGKVESQAKLGYAFDADFWQHEYALKYYLSKKHKFSLQALYRDKIQTRKTINAPPNGNATAYSLLMKHDPYDYHREKGIAITSAISPLKQTILSVTYNNFKQSRMINNTDYAFFYDDSTYRDNLPITDGYMRTINAYFEYDSNKKLNIKGKETSIFSYPYTSIRIGTEISDKSTLQSDFEFQTAYAKLYTTRQLLGIGRTSIGIYGTTKLSGHLPPQRYTIMDFGGNILDEDMTYKTLAYTNFTATELLSVYFNHRFGTRLFKKSKIPLIKDIPYSFSIHGGVFWAELNGNNYNIRDEQTFQTTKNPYSEIGFDIGRLPLMIKLSFTWQLSTYDSDSYAMGFGFDF